MPSCLLATLLLLIPGCNIGGVLADGLAGGERRVRVAADYRDLEHQSVAVLVSADRHALFYSPRARERVAREVSAGIAEHVEGATLIDPRELDAFTSENAYWETLRPSRLLDALGVDRMVWVDLVEYRTHEPGNHHIWRGQVTANVAVYAADADDPDDSSYYRSLTANYPEDNAVGVVNPDTDRQTIELGMVKVFGRNVVRLFHDHEVRR